MACLTNSGILLGCGNQSTGGLRKVWITSLSNLDYDQIAFDSNGVITGLTSAVSAGTIFYEYESNRQVANVIETGTIDDTVGSVGYKQDLVMRFSRQDNDKRNEMLYLASTTVVAIVEDYNGKFKLIGAKEGLRPTVMNAQTGAKLEEGNMYDVTLTGFESELAPFISSKSVFSSFLLS